MSSERDVTYGKLQRSLAYPPYLIAFSYPFQVDSNKKLGEWVGLCKLDKEGKARKVVGCSCVAVKEYGEETRAHDILNDHFKKQKA